MRGGEGGGLAVALLIGSSDEQWMDARNRETRRADHAPAPTTTRRSGGWWQPAHLFIRADQFVDGLDLKFVLSQSSQSDGAKPA